MQTVWIAIGGGLGSMARYWLAVWGVSFSRDLPWATILINVIGSFAIGFFGTLTLPHGRYPLPDSARLFFMAGVCGGFTTFSAFSLQTLELLRLGSPGRALANVAISVILCLTAVSLGHGAAWRLNAAADLPPPAAGQP